MPREVKDNGTGMQKEGQGFGITGKFAYLCKKENGGIMAIALGLAADLPTFVKKKMEESWQ